MIRKLLALAAVLAMVLLIGAELTAEEKVLVLTNGRRIRGEITKTADGYEVKTATGMTAVIAAKDVLRVEDVATPTSGLAQRLAKIDQKDPDALYDVAKWAVQQNMLPEARDLLKQVLKLKPDHRLAGIRLKLVEMRIASERPTTRNGRTTTGPIKPIKVNRSMLLTQEDVYRIRLAELTAEDRVAIEFRNKVLDRFIAARRGVGLFAEPGGEARFRAGSRIRQAQYILRNTDERDFAIRDDILVKNDPLVLREFRTRIWPFVAANCAKPSCHGGARGAGKLRLLNLPSTQDRVVYTNFYILHAWSRDGRKLIDRKRREMSLLLQHGLPADLARTPHPAPTGVIYRSRETRNYVNVDRWIGRLRWPFLPPGYRVKYDKVPGMPKATETTTQPSIFE